MQTSYENKEKYQLGDYQLIKCQILQTNSMRTVWQTVRRITNEILGVKGLSIERKLNLLLVHVSLALLKFSFSSCQINCRYNYINFLTRMIFLLLLAGHYVTFAKNYINGKWYEFNDSWVSEGMCQSCIREINFVIQYDLMIQTTCLMILSW